MSTAVVGAPPFIQEETSSCCDNSITIVYPQYYNYQKNGNITLNFDILNSTYAKLDNIKATCTIKSVDSKGIGVFETNLTYDSDDKHWYHIIDNELDVGLYSYYVYCNSTQKENGFVSQGYEIMLDNVPASDDLTPIAILVLIPLFLSALCMFSIFALGNNGHSPLKLFLYIASFISVSVSYNYMVKVISTFYNSTSLLEFIASDYAWYGQFLYIIIVYFILYWMIQIFNYLMQNKKKRFNFEENDQK